MLMNQKKMEKNKLLWVIVPLIFLAILVLWKVIPLLEESLVEKKEIVEASPEQLSQNKEAYENKQVILLNAYIPSEAYIYVKNEGLGEKIFIEPSNKIYCRNFNLIGTLKKDIIKKWVFYIEESECVE